MRRNVLICAASATVALLSGCVSDPDLYLDTMTGAGSARVLPDGSSGFTFAINENAFHGIVPQGDAVALRAQHARAIANWVGQSGVCGRGYLVGDSRMIDGVYLYEGSCK